MIYCQTCLFNVVYEVEKHIIPIVYLNDVLSGTSGILMHHRKYETLMQFYAKNENHMQYFAKVIRDVEYDMHIIT